MIECPICYEIQQTSSMIKCKICNNECCKKCRSKINKCSFCRHSFENVEEIKTIDPNEHIESNNYTFLASISCAYRFLLLLYICSVCSLSEDSQDSQD